MERDPQKRSQGFRDWERTVAGCAVPCPSTSITKNQAETCAGRRIRMFHSNQNQNCLHNIRLFPGDSDSPVPKLLCWVLTTAGRYHNTLGIDSRS